MYTPAVLDVNQAFDAIGYERLLHKLNTNMLDQLYMSITYWTDLNTATNYLSEKVFHKAILVRLYPINTLNIPNTNTADIHQY